MYIIRIPVTVIQFFSKRRISAILINFTPVIYISNCIILFGFSIVINVMIAIRSICQLSILEEYTILVKEIALYCKRIQKKLINSLACFDICLQLWCNCDITLCNLKGIVVIVIPIYLCVTICIIRLIYTLCSLTNRSILLITLESQCKCILTTPNYIFSSVCTRSLFLPIQIYLLRIIL